MRTSTSRIVAAGAVGAAVGLTIGLVLGASGPVPFLLAVFGMAIAATFAQDLPASPRAPRAALAELTAPENPAPAWLPDPLGSGHERLWDGQEWTRHVWPR